MILDIFDGGGEILFWSVFRVARSVDTLRDHPGGVVAEFVFGFEPGFAGGEILRAIVFDEGDPFVESAAGFGFEFGDPFLDHGDAGVDVVKRTELGGGFRHGGLQGWGSLAQMMEKAKRR